MSWWVIALILLAAFGPVLWIMPSRRDRLLARLRSGARQRGLLVELATIPDTNAPPEARVSAGGKPREATIACTAYRLPLPRVIKHAPRWRLLATGRRGEGPVEGWTFDGAAAGDPEYWRRMREPFARVPKDVLAVEVQRSEVGLYWKERIHADPEPGRGPVADQVDGALDTLSAALQGFAAAHEAEERRLVEALDGPENDLA